MTVTNSTLSNNRASTRGGGIDNEFNSTVTITGSTLSGNHGGSDGGAIFDNGGTPFTVTNSTLSGNSANNGGGIEHNGSGTFTVTNSTLTGNSAISSGGNGGGGILNPSMATVTLTNTIVAGNMAAHGGPDLNGTFATGGNNLIGTIAGSMGITNGTKGDIVNNTPLLGTLGPAGGPTQTIPLLAGSPAIGHGNTMICAQMGVGKVGGKDQRGLPRPAANCAIGAFEPQQATFMVGNTGDGAAMATLADCTNPTNTICQLRDALSYAAPAGHHPVQQQGSGKITLTNDMQHGTLTLVGNVTITGPTTGTGVIVDGGCTGSCNTTNATGGVTVFAVNSGVTAALNNLTIQHGNSGLLSGRSGGITNLGGMLTVTGCTFTANAAINGDGGAIRILSGTLTLKDSTITGNAAASGGGGIANFGMLTVTNSTITGNSTTAYGGGGIEQESGTATLTNTIVAGNTLTGFGSGPDLKGAVMSGGHNLVGTTDGSSGITNGTNGDNRQQHRLPLNPCSAP